MPADQASNRKFTDRQVAPPTPPAMLTMELIGQHYFPVSKRTIGRLLASDKFPRPDISMGGKIRLWKRETIESWLRERTAETAAGVSR